MRMRGRGHAHFELAPPSHTVEPPAITTTTPKITRYIHVYDEIAMSAVKCFSCDGGHNVVESCLGAVIRLETPENAAVLLHPK